MRLLEDSKVAEDVPQDDEDNDAHAAAAARQFSGSITSGNPTQQLAHRNSAIKVKSRALQSHDSYRGIPRGSSVTGAELHCDLKQGQVAQLVEQRTENPRVGGSIPSLAIKQ